MPSVKSVTPEFDPETNEPLLNWTKTSNRMIELFTQKKITGDVQFAILLRIAKETWGHLPKRPWMRLVVTKEAEKLNCTRQALMNALKDAESRNLIESKKADDGKNRGQLFRLTNWRDVLDRSKAEKKPKPDKADITADSRNTMVLLPGHSGTLTVDLMVNNQVARISVKCHNTLDQRAAFQADPGNDGEVIVSILQRPKSANDPETETGEQKADVVYSGLDTIATTFTDNKGVNEKREKSSPNRHHNEKSEHYAPAPPPPHRRPTAVPPAENPARREFETFVTQLRQEVWGVSTDPEFLRRIVEKMGDTPMPAEALERRLIVRFGKAYRGPLSREKTGLLLDLAGDALNDWRASEAQRKSIPETQSMSDEEWRRFLDSLPPEDRADLERRQALDAESQHRETRKATA